MELKAWGSLISADVVSLCFLFYVYVMTGKMSDRKIHVNRTVLTY